MSRRRIYDNRLIFVLFKQNILSQGRKYWADRMEIVDEIRFSGDLFSLCKNLNYKERKKLEQIS